MIIPIVIVLAAFAAWTWAAVALPMVLLGAGVVGTIYCLAAPFIAGDLKPGEGDSGVYWPTLLAFVLSALVGGCWAWSG